MVVDALGALLFVAAFMVAWTGVGVLEPQARSGRDHRKPPTD